MTSAGTLLMSGPFAGLAGRWFQVGRGEGTASTQLSLRSQKLAWTLLDLWIGLQDLVVERRHRDAFPLRELYE